MTRFGTHRPAVLAPSLRSVHASGTKVMRATNFELFKIQNSLYDMARTPAHFTHCSHSSPKTLRNGTLRSVPLRWQNACKCQCSFSMKTLIIRTGPYAYFSRLFIQDDVISHDLYNIYHVTFIKGANKANSSILSNVVVISCDSHLDLILSNIQLPASILNLQCPFWMSMQFAYLCK